MFYIERPVCLPVDWLGYDPKNWQGSMAWILDMSVIKILSAHLKFDAMFLKELKPARNKARVRIEVYNLNISSHKGEEMAQESRHFH